MARLYSNENFPCTFDPDFLGQASRIHAALNAQANLASQLIRINRPAA